MDFEFLANVYTEMTSTVTSEFVNAVGRQMRSLEWSIAELKTEVENLQDAKDYLEKKIKDDAAAHKGAVRAMAEKIEEAQVQVHWAQRREEYAAASLQNVRDSRDLYKQQAEDWAATVKHLIANQELAVSGALMMELLTEVAHDERPELLAEIDLTAKTKKIEAIIMLRKFSNGLSLKDAKEFVEARMEFLGFD